MLHVVLEHDPAIEDQRIVDEGFLTAQAERVGDPHLDVFACFLRDERRPIQGGLLGRLWWRWLYVERLWVTPALRGRGFGRHLLERAEAHARQAGCGAAFVDTFDPTSFGAAATKSSLRWPIFRRANGNIFWPKPSACRIDQMR